jgi:hypothetical protein
LLIGASIYQRGEHVDLCQQQPNLYEHLKIYRDAKLAGLQNKGQSTRAVTQPIASAVFRENRGMELVKEVNVHRAVNRARAKLS